MNPNASVFVPSIKLDPEEQRTEQIQCIQQQIQYQKQVINDENIRLIALHQQLINKHSVLVNQMKRKEDNQFPCFTQKQIDALNDEYQQEAKIYYANYSKFNDKTSELVTLQQQLHKLLIKPANSCSPPSTPRKSSESKSNGSKKQGKVGVNNKDFASKNKLSIRVFDGIDPKILSPKGCSTMGSPQSILPPIIEDDDEYAWNDDSDNEAHDEHQDVVQDTDNDVMTDHDAPSINSDYNQSMTNPNNKSSPTPIAIPTESSMSPIMQSFTFPDIDKINNNQCDDNKCNENGDEKYDHYDKENIDPNLTPNPNSTSNPNPKPNPPKEITQESDKAEAPKQPFDSDEKINNNKDKKLLKSKRIIPDYIAFENKIHTMLENIQYAEVNKPCDDMNAVLNTLCVNCKCVEILIDMIISHAVQHKPIFFGAKYSLICQSIVNNYKPNRGIVINDDVDEYQRMQQLDVKSLVYKSVNDTFKKVSVGNDTVKFINVMIIIAELFNANLVDAEYIFDTVFHSLLCDSQYADLWENDIEGIFEIFQRCTRHLTQEKHKERLHRYVRMMDKIKNWRKFDHGLRRVPFMVNQIKILTNYHKLADEFGHKYNDHNNYHNNYHHKNDNYRPSYHNRQSSYHHNRHNNNYHHQYRRNDNHYNNNKYDNNHNNHNNNTNYRRYNHYNDERERDIPPRHNNINNHNSYRRKW